VTGQLPKPQVCFFVGWVDLIGPMPATGCQIRIKFYPAPNQNSPFPQTGFAL
jgi:hypothetical protein